jgi:hypothetical protein
MVCCIHVYVFLLTSSLPCMVAVPTVSPVIRARGGTFRFFCTTDFKMRGGPVSHARDPSDNSTKDPHSCCKIESIAGIRS